MDSTIELAGGAQPRAAQTAATKQIRGSGLLLVGRMLAAVVNFASQLLIVRHLAKSDYGAFEYALSIVAMGEMVSSLGLDRAVGRFLPIYHERRDFGRLFGTVFLAVGTILSLGVALLLLAWLSQGALVRQLIDDRQAATLFLILVALVPVQALDGIVSALFAIFVGPRSIFFRRHVLAPGMKFTIVLLLVMHGGDVFFLASGYVAAAMIGLTLYIALLVRALVNQGLFGHFRLAAVRFPSREVFVFAIPLLSSDLMHIVMNTMDAVFLKYFHNTAEVAIFRAVQPAARLNHLVLNTSSLLFMPLASRLFARQDHDGINDLYRQTTVWLMVISFPVFLVTFAFARPFTLTLYGRRYEESAAILAVLALGYYINTALGLNSLTLAALGKVRFVVVANFLSVALNLGLNLTLIPRYGAFGAAVGTCSAVVARNVVLQTGLQRSAGIDLFEWGYLKVALVASLLALGMLAVQAGLSPPVPVSAAMAALGIVAAFVFNRQALGVGKVFPELMRIPLARRLFKG